MELISKSLQVHHDTVERKRIEGEIEATKTEIEQAEQVIANNKAILIGMCMEDYTESMRVTADFNDVTAEIQELRRLLGVDEEAADMLDEALENMREAEFDKELEKITERNRETAKKLFRKISRLCHPDVCDDEEKVALFAQAREAYKRAEVQVLESILKFLLNMTSLPPQFRTKIEELMNDLLALKQRLATLINSPEYHAKDEDDFDILAHQYRAALRQSSSETRAMLQTAGYTLQYLRNLKRERNV